MFSTATIHGQRNSGAAAASWDGGAWLCLMGRQAPQACCSGSAPRRSRALPEGGGHARSKRRSREAQCCLGPGGEVSPSAVAAGRTRSTQRPGQARRHHGGSLRPWGEI
jgi:hypothetical protein